MITRPGSSTPLRRPWPMTSEALSALEADVATIEADIERLSTDRQPDPADVPDPALAHAARRLATLRAVLGDAERIDDENVVVIGRRATLSEEDGASVTYAVVFPGDGDPPLGWISADSPLGAALLGARPGDTVAVDAPGGRRSVEVTAVA